MNAADVRLRAALLMAEHHLDLDHPGDDDACVCGRRISKDLGAGPDWNEHLADELSAAGLLAVPVEPEETES